MINSIMDTRMRRDDGHYHINLKIPKDEYEVIYEGNYSNENAADILTYYLEMRGDDGKPKNIYIKQAESPNMVEIQADLEYFHNEHTDYVKSPGHFFLDIMNSKDKDVWIQQKNDNR
ncbi:MAG: hypothetical protein GX308_04210 [Epulopiscium sp.]|nr:hypothetical protein [Candidatus Epulonipiscium sp.]